jgi:hypothetical protein
LEWTARNRLRAPVDHDDVVARAAAHLIAARRVNVRRCAGIDEDRSVAEGESDAERVCVRVAAVQVTMAPDVEHRVVATGIARDEIPGIRKRARRRRG